MSNEQDLVPSPKPVTEPPQKKGVSRIRFFKILTPRPAVYDAILAAYGEAPQMPAIQIPRAATSIGDRVEITDIDIPGHEELDFSNEPIQRGDGLRVLRRPREVVVVSQTHSEHNFPPSQIQPTTPSQHDADLETNLYLKKPAA